MQYLFASSNVPSVSWYMPTALDAGRYTPNGWTVHDQRQYVRATGFPDPSTCANAASNSGDITLVENFSNAELYWRHVSAGVLFRVSLTGKNSSEGLRMT